MFAVVALGRRALIALRRMQRELQHKHHRTKCNSSSSRSSRRNTDCTEHGMQVQAGCAKAPHSRSQSRNQSRGEPAASPLVGHAAPITTELRVRAGEQGGGENCALQPGVTILPPWRQTQLQSSSDPACTRSELGVAAVSDMAYHIETIRRTIRACGARPDINKLLAKPFSDQR